MPLSKSPTSVPTSVSAVLIKKVSTPPTSPSPSPSNQAFDSINFVLAFADLVTPQTVLKYHIILNNVIFSPSLGNVTVPSLQGDNLTFTVLPDGTAWVNNAKITFPNTLLYSCVASMIAIEDRKVGALANSITGEQESINGEL